MSFPGGRVGLDEALGLAASSSDRYAVLLETGVLELGWYAPRDHDPQSPHDRDELYIVAAGDGWLELEGERLPARPGDVLKVPAGAAHRFVDFSEDFGVWVVFWRESGEGVRRSGAGELAALQARHRQLGAWRYAGPALLLLLALLAGWLAASSPLLVRPMAVARAMEEGSLAEPTIAVMAALLPLAMLGCLGLALVLVLLGWWSGVRERRLISRVLAARDTRQLPP